MAGGVTAKVPTIKSIVKHLVINFVINPKICSKYQQESILIEINQNIIQESKRRKLHRNDSKYTISKNKNTAYQNTKARYPLKIRVS